MKERAELERLLKEQQEQIETLSKEVEKRQSQLDRMKERLRLLLKRLYGRRSEKIDPNQLRLFEEGDEVEEEIPAHATEAPDDEDARTPRKKRRLKPRALKLKDLPRVRIEHDIAPEAKLCACCGGEKHKIGEEVTEELEYVPASIFVNEHVRPKYACRKCGDGVVIADLPKRLIDGGLAGPGIVAQVVTAKYADHLPLYRQEAIFKRHGLELSRRTMCDWVRLAAELLLPVVLAMKRQLLKRPVILADETPVLCQTNSESKGCHKAFLWVWLSPEEDTLLYDFQLSRGQSVVEEYLKDFEGEVLVADGYPGYNPCEKRGVKRAGCMAHARRYVHDALGTHPLEASELLALIQMLYLVERRGRELELNAADLRKLRQQESCPLLDDLEAAVDRLKPEILPTSTLGSALKYIHNQWSALKLFADDGRIPIDNNASERAIRPVAVGRKNWMFAGSPEGGRRTATLYSLVQTCRRLGIDPFEYLRDVLDRVSTHPDRLIEELTPAGWKKLRTGAQESS